MILIAPFLLFAPPFSNGNCVEGKDLSGIGLQAFDNCDFVFSLLNYGVIKNTLPAVLDVATSVNFSIRTRLNFCCLPLNTIPVSNFIIYRAL